MRLNKSSIEFGSVCSSIDVNRLNSLKNEKKMTQLTGCWIEQLPFLRLDIISGIEPSIKFKEWEKTHIFVSLVVVMYLLQKLKIFKTSMI